MGDSAVVTVRLSPDAKTKLEALARNTRRSKSFLAAEAIDRFLAEEAAFIAAVEEGVAAAERGEVVGHDAVKEWVDSWSSPTERPRPDRR